MLNRFLRGKRLILASQSPRRHAILKEMGLNFTIRVNPIKECYPLNLKRGEITHYLSRLKASAFTKLEHNDILITSDTIVWFDEKPLEKPKDKAQACEMLQKLSGNSHEVITSICLTSKEKQRIETEYTKVFFKNITQEEIEFYVENYAPFDKAGAYGIQEWLGYTSVEKIEGSYFNVMGLPTHLLYNMLKEFVSSVIQVN